MTAVLAAGAIIVRRGPATILGPVDIAIQSGTLVGVIGPNGAGKTTAMRCLAGIETPASGTVSLDGRPLTAIPPRARSSRIGYLAQGGEVNWPLTVERLVALGRLPHLGPWSAPTGDDAAAVATALDQCDVAHLADRPVTTLSGGERARALIARVLAGHPDFLLADEPVAGLDPRHQLRVMGLLRAQADSGCGVAVVLHDLSLAARHCHRLVLLDGGRLVADGPPETVLEPGTLERVYGVQMGEAVIDGVAVPIPLRPT